ncbi:MAG: Trp biosynthesis-associated membrane protein [Mycobacteriales bacterium]
MSNPARGGRTELGVAVLLAVLGGALALFAVSRQWWIEQTPRPAPLSSLWKPIRGTDTASWSAAAGLVSLAGALALLATRRLGRLAVGVLILGAGASVVTAGVAGLGAEPAAGSSRINVAVVWPVVTILAGGLAAASGVLTCLHFRRWHVRSAGLGSRYEAPTALPRAGSVADTATVIAAGDSPGGGDPALLWDALDRGIDPTKAATQPPPTGSSVGP